MLKNILYTCAGGFIGVGVLYGGAWMIDRLPHDVLVMLTGGVMIGAPMFVQMLLMAKARPVVHVHQHLYLHGESQAERGQGRAQQLTDALPVVTVR